MRDRRVPLHLSRPTRPAGARAPVGLPQGPKQAMLVARITRFVAESGVEPQWAALYVLSVAFGQALRSKFPIFDLRRVFELLYHSEKEKAGEPDTLQDAAVAWYLARELPLDDVRGVWVELLVRLGRQEGVSLEALKAELDAEWAQQDAPA